MGSPRRWFQRTVLTRPWLCFVALGLSFFAFGAGSINLFFLMRANVALVLEHGWVALMEGAPGGWSVAGLCSWPLTFRREQRLTRWLLDERA
ncbi:MAG: hypothetical protein U5L74_14685 [Ideonella sp.]|nr:hypothetical protein [Ideonella sp.]